MGSKKIIECHSCESEITILDKYDDIESDKILYCPLCGSENIQVQE